MTNKIATEQYLINLAGGGTNTPTKCATRDRVEFFGLETNDNYANNQAYIGGDTANISINVII